MMILSIILCIVWSIISTAVLSYISMAVMIGPWIHSIIIITSSLIFSFLGVSIYKTNRVRDLVLITACSSIGGILATGCGFAFPTLYFLQPDLFNAWLSSPLRFVCTMSALAFAAGALGLLIADFFETKVITVDKLPFPVGEVSYQLIVVQSIKETYQLIAGALCSAVYSAAAYFLSIAHKITVVSPVHAYGLRIPAIGIPIHEFPLLLSIGFIAGAMVVIPMALGIATKIMLINPSHHYFFSYLSANDFSFAFVSGMVVYGALLSLLELPKFFKGLLQKARSLRQSGVSSMSGVNYIEWALVLVFIVGFLSFFKFGLMTQLYLILFTIACTYQLIVIGGEIGLAPVARFATFVMMPAMFLFAPDYIQLTIIATFVEVCGGVAVDVLFGRKLAQLAGVARESVRRFQWLGLVVSSLSVGIVFLILIRKFGLGTDALLAQRSQTRALTIQFQNFDFYAMVFGALYGSILKEFKISPIMVLGGILMPIDWALSLVIGGAFASLLSNAKEYQSFWSGVFAVNSLIMIVRAIV